METRMRNSPQWPQSIPRWLHFVMAAARAGSAAPISTAFFFAPVPALASPWPVLTTVLWIAAARAGTAGYAATGFFSAPVLALQSPWPVLTTVLWIAIALAELWLGLLDIAMANGLAIVLRSNTEIPEDYWRSIIDYPSPTAA